MKLNDENRTVIGFVIFVIFFIIGLVLIDRENEEIESDNKD